MTPEIVNGIIKKFGSQTKLAAATGYDQSTIAHWKRRGVIPARAQGRVLAAARGASIDITPDDFFEPAAQ